MQNLNFEKEQKWEQCLDSFSKKTCRMKKKYEHLTDEEECEKLIQCLKEGAEIPFSGIMVYSISETMKEISSIGIPLLLILMLGKFL